MEILERPETKYKKFIVFGLYFELIITRLNRPKNNYKYLSYYFFIVNIKTDTTVYQKSIKFINGKLKK